MRRAAILQRFKRLEREVRYRQLQMVAERFGLDARELESEVQFFQEVLDVQCGGDRELFLHFLAPILGVSIDELRRNVNEIHCQLQVSLMTDDSGHIST